MDVLLRFSGVILLGSLFVDKSWNCILYLSFLIQISNKKLNFSLTECYICDMSLLFLINYSQNRVHWRVNHILIYKIFHLYLKFLVESQISSDKLTLSTLHKLFPEFCRQSTYLKVKNIYINITFPLWSFFSFLFSDWKFLSCWKLTVVSILSLKSYFHAIYEPRRLIFRWSIYFSTTKYQISSEIKHSRMNIYFKIPKWLGKNFLSCKISSLCCKELLQGGFSMFRLFHTWLLYNWESFYLFVSSLYSSKFEERLRSIM